MWPLNFRDAAVAGLGTYVVGRMLNISHRATLTGAFGIACAAAVLNRSFIGLRRALFPLEEWIDSAREVALEPDLPIIDPHHHLWDARTQPKGWPIPQRAIQMLVCAASPLKL